MNRETSASRAISAGCYTCSGQEAKWTGPNAQALAARHHDATGHATWCDISLQVRYGREGADPRQLDIEAAIARAIAA